VTHTAAMADVDPRDGGDGASQAEAVVEQFEAMRREADSLWGKLTELDLERQEHELVLKTLQPLDAGRRCFRLVGGVLVERTVGEVCPAVERHKQALEQVRACVGRRSRRWLRGVL
jgi:chaperonin cofactor prefoldin